MSGLYAIAWSEAEKTTSSDECLLRKTSGGWAHVTVAYYGNQMAPDNLRVLMRRHTNDLVGHESQIVGYRRNVFECGGRTRYDVLLTLDDETTALIDRVRSQMPVPRYAHQAPHITWKISWDAKTHERDCERVEKLLSSGPHPFTLTGLSFD